MIVTSCAPAKTGKYPEVLFTGRVPETGEDVVVGMPASSAERQLGRMQTTMAEVAGETITISRDPNQSDATKPFWGINWGEPTNLPASGPIVAPRASQGPRTAPRDDTPPPDDRDAPAGVSPAQSKMDGLFKAYQACWNEAVRLARSTTPELVNEPGIAPLDLNAMASTLLIQLYR